MGFLPAGLVRGVSMTALKLSKHSPNLLFGAGIVGGIGTIVLASRATLRLEDIIAEAQENFAKVADAEKKGKWTETEILQARVGVYIRAAGSITKLYGPALIVGGLSIAALTGSHHILSKRNAALAAAYKMLEKGFQSYRNRVIDDLGEDADKKYLLGVEKTKETVVDASGKSKKVTKQRVTGTSAYGKMFHAGNPNWNDSPGMNLIFLKAQENYLNDQLQVRGWLTLNDVYDALGFDRTKAGCVVGWLRDGKGDRHVDLGVFNRENLGQVYDYISDVEDEIHINPNCDGEIQSKLVI